MEPLLTGLSRILDFIFRCWFVFAAFLSEVNKDITGSFITVAFFRRQILLVVVSFFHSFEKSLLVNKWQQINSHPGIGCSINIKAEVDGIKINNWTIR